MRWSWLLALAACSSSTTSVDGGGDGGREVRVDDCLPSAIAEALGAARPGDVVRFGACELAGASLTVPAGVVLAGSGPGASTVEVDTPIEIEAGAMGCSGVRDLKIVSSGDFAIRTVGPGEVCIDSVEIESSEGGGISAEGTTLLTVRESSITGPVTADNADEQPPPPFPVPEGYVGRDGLVANCVERVVLENVVVRGWAAFGVLVVSGRLEWRSGRIVETLGAGLVVHRGEAVLFDLEIAEIYQGARLLPAYAVVSSESVMTSSMLWVHDSQGYGALHNGGRADHAAARFEDNALAGTWVQLGELAVGDSSFEGNGMAAIAGAAAGDVRIERSLLARSVLMTRIVGVTAVEVGGGLVLDAQGGPVTLRDVRIEDVPGHAGLITLPAGYDRAFDVQGVTVSGGGLGFVVAGGPPPDGWIDGVSPAGVARQEDEPPYEIAGALSAADIPAFNPSCE